ncbi:MAG: hypothetical protein FJ144_28655 [Deltaproteobacteria bacterium]|nr:hypothetical protein [Deltaproteobacteria bacterium]
MNDAEAYELIERIAKMLHEPLDSEGWRHAIAARGEYPPLSERLVEAVDRLMRRNHSLEKSEDELRMLRAAWAPVVHAAVMQSVSLSVTDGDHAEWQRCCENTERAVQKLTKDQRKEAEP